MSARVVTLEDLIAKRHEGSGWQVFTELPNGTGGRANRRADVIAIGLWPSHKYEIHGYEVKQSRGDVRRELTDISKSDAVGRFCDYWSLVVSDLSIIADLLIPPTWGILVPERAAGGLSPQSRLRVHRKPGKRQALPVNRAFVAAMFQHMAKSWVDRRTHQRVVDSIQAQRTARQSSDPGQPSEEAEREVTRLRSCIAAFEKASGITLEAENGKHIPWRFGDVGAAVKIVMATRTQPARSLADARLLERLAGNLKDMSDRATTEAAVLRTLLEPDAPQEAPAEQNAAQENTVPPKGKGMGIDDWESWES